MMIRAILFADADWLCHATTDWIAPGELGLLKDPRRLAATIADELGRRHQIGHVDVVRTHVFGSRPSHWVPADDEIARRRHALLDRLRDEPHLDLETFPFDCQHRPMAGDHLGDPSRLVALAIAALRYASMPSCAFDLGIFLVGDRALVPLLQEIRRFGKRVAVVVADGATATELTEPADPLRVRDFEPLWINDLMDRLERARTRETLRSESEPAAENFETGEVLKGRIKNLIWDRGYGFIAAEDGLDYFFHVHALEPGLEFDELQPEMSVEFEVKSGPMRGRAGAARTVRSSGAAPAFAGNAPDVDADDGDVAAEPEEAAVDPAGRPGEPGARDPGLQRALGVV